jgi:hypothetical protein
MYPMETVSYFLRYLWPTLLSLLSVGALALINRVVGVWLWADRIADPTEVLAYTIRTTGPIVFSLAFLTFFYGLESLRESWPWTRAAFFASLGLLIAAIVVNIIFIPKVR